MWKIGLYTIVYLICVNGENTDMLVPDNNNIFDSITECIKNISQQELKYKPTVVIDTQYIKQKTESNIFITEVTEKLMANNIAFVIITEKPSKKMIHNTLVIEDDAFGRKYILCALVILYFDNCNDIFLFDFNLINKEIKHLVIVAEPNRNECNDKLLEIKNVDIYDLTFIFTDGVTNDINKMFSFIPKIDKHKCIHGTDGATHINTCINGTMENNIVFPWKKPTNLNKCPLKVGMATLYPYSMIKNKESLKTYDSIDEAAGSDMEIIKIIAENLNATIDLHYIYKTEENPIGDNEFLKYLFIGDLEICAGGMYRIYGDIVAYSGVYSRQAISWIYYAERAERSWKSLVGKVTGLYVFIIYYITYSVIWYIIRTFDGNAVSLKDTLFYGWGALVGATSLQDPRSTKQKILNLMYLIMSIHLSAYISIQLYSFLTIREPPTMFTTNDEVMQSGRVPYLKESTKYFVHDKKYTAFANTSGGCVSFVDCARKTYLYNGLTVMLQGNFYDFISDTTVDGEARILRATENILTVYHEMIIRKESPLISKYYSIVQSLFEAGITERLYNEAIGILVMAKADTATSNMMLNSYSCQAGCAITFMQFAGVFYVWIFGCILSCIVFAFELCINRERKDVILR